MTESDADAMLRRLRWRARRGVLELDLIFSAFLDAHGENLSANEAREMEALLEKEDDELLRLLIYNPAREKKEEIKNLLALIKQKRNRR